MAVGQVSPYNAGEAQVVAKVITTFADVGAGNISVMYGTTISVHRQLEITERLFQCLEALIEEGFPTPVANRVATLSIDGGKGQVVIAEQADIAVPNEANVSIAYNVTFDNSPASTLNLEVTAARLIDETNHALGLL